MGNAQLKVFEGEFSAPKYQSKNPIAKALVDGFLGALVELVDIAKPTTIHEIGCGEGQLSGLLKGRGYDIRGCDHDDIVLNVAQKNAKAAGLDISLVKGDVYKLNAKTDSADLVMCCEVMEHLEEPEKALENLIKIAKPYLLLSVPREPIWRGMNMVRGKYWTDLGNTPTHINHWSTAAFVKMVQEKIDIVEIRQPLPWTMILCKKR